jgi:hypothetical protein
MLFQAVAFGLFVIATAEPAGYKFNVDAPADSAVTVKIDGKKVEPGRVYATDPFVGTKTVSYEVTYFDRDQKRDVTVRGTFPVEAGYLTELTFTVPRYYIAHRPPAD